MSSLALGRYLASEYLELFKTQQSHVALQPGHWRTNIPRCFPEASSLKVPKGLQPGGLCGSLDVLSKDPCLQVGL